MFPDDIHAAIGGSPVNNDVFDVWISLLQHRCDGFFKERGLIEAWRDN
jgi:hypothetical protein